MAPLLSKRPVTYRCDTAIQQTEFCRQKIWHHAKYLGRINQTFGQCFFGLKFLFLGAVFDITEQAKPVAFDTK